MNRKENEGYEGHLVRLRYDIRTKGGELFPKDSVCRVTSVYRGELTLRMRNPDPDNIFGPRNLIIRRVRALDVELLPCKK